MNFDFTSIESTVHYIKGFGIYGPAAAFVLFFVQAVAPIVPYIIIAGAVGMIYGKWIGFLLAWVGAICGAWFLFWISGRIAGSFFVKKLRQRYDFDLTKIEGRYVFWVLLVCRIFPVVPTPIINIGSALAGVSTKIFLSSSILGKLPWAFIYVTLGDYLMKTKNITTTLTLIGLIFLVSFVGITYFRKMLPRFYR